MAQTTAFTSKHAQWITPVFFFLALYTVGAATLDSFAMYHTWRFVGKADFAIMHMESGKRIIRVLVLPSAIMTVFLVLQFWHRPKAVSRGLVCVSLICTIITWLSSFLIQIPLQIRLDTDMSVLEQLIQTDWIRVISNAVFAVVIFLMLKNSIQEKGVSRQ